MSPVWMFYMLYSPAYDAGKNFGMIHLRFSIYIVICLAGLLCGCSGSAGNEDELRRIDRECSRSTEEWKSEKSDSLARQLLAKASACGDKRFEARAHYYLGTFVPNSPLPDDSLDAREAELAVSLSMASESDDSRLLCSVYNSMGLWEMARRKNYHTAIYYLKKSAELAHDTGNDKLEIASEMNISELYRLLGDTLGFQYDRRLFDYAMKTGDSNSMLVSSGLRCALYLARTAADSTALKPYIDAIRGSEIYSPMIPYIRASFCFSHGDYAGARQWMLRGDVRYNFDTLLFYARILNRLGLYGESNVYAEELERDIERMMLGVGWIDVYQLLASNYEKMGNLRPAYDYFRRYEHLKDSINQRLKQDEINKYHVEYEVAKKNQEIEVQRARVRQLWFIVAAVTLFFAVIVTAYVLYTLNRRRFYRRIVRQYRESMERERVLRKEILAQKECDGAAQEGRNAASVAGDKADGIYRRICHEMDTNGIWRDMTVTRETFADRIGCNRTYFSDVIRQKTGMTYPQYMNSFRVREAIRILSGPDGDVPMKELGESLGFLSPRNFSRVFKQATGLSPQDYRRTAQEISREETA